MREERHGFQIPYPVTEQAAYIVRRAICAHVGACLPQLPKPEIVQSDGKAYAQYSHEQTAEERGRVAKRESLQAQRTELCESPVGDDAIRVGLELRQLIGSYCACPSP